MSDRSSGDAHVFPLRVYFEDTDAGGIVYYANYLKFAERARTEMLREIGIESSKMMRDHKAAFAVRRCNAEFLKSARLDDTLEVRSRVLDVGGATLDGEQRIFRGPDELVSLSIRLACIGHGGKPKRLPAGVRASLQQLCSRSGSS